jgi:hypothetical protein
MAERPIALAPAEQGAPTWLRFGFFGTSSSIKDYDAKHLEWVRAAIAHSLDLLKANHSADRFAGRKTQEPFPRENEASGGLS